MIMDKNTLDTDKSKSVIFGLTIGDALGYDPEEAIVRAVNDTKDNDTIAAIVVAAVGAIHGKKALPERWINNLSGRTSFSDDGKVFELLDKTKFNWDE